MAKFVYYNLNPKQLHVNDIWDCSDRIVEGYWVR